MKIKLMYKFIKTIKNTMMLCKNDNMQFYRYIKIIQKQMMINITMMKEG